MLDDEGIPFEFDGLTFDDLLLDCILGDETIHVDFVFLSDTMGAVHGL